MPNETSRAAVAVYSRALLDTDSLDDDSRSVDVIVSTEALDSHGTRVKQNWQLERFRKNPVVLKGHDRNEMPLGLGRNIGVVDGALRATIDFAPDDVNPEAGRFLKAMRTGLVRGISIGFYPHTVTFEKEDDREFVVLDDNELFEFSVVAVPSNPETLAQLRARALNQDNPTETQQMSELMKALGATTEKDALATIAQLRAFQNDNRSTIALGQGVAALTGVAGDEALGMVRAWQEAHGNLSTVQTELETLKKESLATEEAREIADLLDSEDTKKKLTKAERDEYRRQLEAKETTVAGVRGFIKVRAPLAISKDDAARPEVRNASSPGELTFDGKSYEELTNAERAALSREDEDLFKSMRSDWEKRGAPSATDAS